MGTQTRDGDFCGNPLGRIALKLVPGLRKDNTRDTVSVNFRDRMITFCSRDEGGEVFAVCRADVSSHCAGPLFASLGSTVRNCHHATTSCAKSPRADDDSWFLTRLSCEIGVNHRQSSKQPLTLLALDKLNSVGTLLIHRLSTGALFAK